MIYYRQITQGNGPDPRTSSTEMPWAVTSLDEKQLLPYLEGLQNLSNWDLQTNGDFSTYLKEAKKLAQWLLGPMHGDMTQIFTSRLGYWDIVTALRQSPELRYVAIADHRDTLDQWMVMVAGHEFAVNNVAAFLCVPFRS